MEILQINIHMTETYSVMTKGVFKGGVQTPPKFSDFF